MGRFSRPVSLLHSCRGRAGPSALHLSSSAPQVWTLCFFFVFRPVCVFCPWSSGGEAGMSAGGPAPAADKSLDRGMTFNRSQRGSCSATYDTLTQNQVVCE